MLRCKAADRADRAGVQVAATGTQANS